MNRRQPICAGVDESGELVWDDQAMELWQVRQLFYKQYGGDLGEQWMWLVAQNKGMDWEIQ